MKEIDAQIRDFLRKVALSGFDYEMGSEAIDLLIALEKSNPCMIGTFALPANKYAEIVKMLAEGEKIQAIKELRTITGAGLKTAKEAIDELKI